MDHNRKTALYVRVSTDSQFEEGYSVEAQTEKLEAWCKVKNYKNTELYVDGGWSGSNIDRPELRRLMGDIAMGKVAVVVVYKLESYNLFAQMLETLNKDVLSFLFKAFVPLRDRAADAPRRPAVQQRPDMSRMQAGRSDLSTNAEQKAKTPVKADKHVGRNDPCPCGSGKKYKNCHGKGLV